jgi:hypothetical protein
MAIACGALVVGEGALLAALGLSEWPLGLSLAVVVHLGMRKDFASSALTLTALLPLIDWMSTGPSGVLPVSLLVVFFLLRVVRGALDARRGPVAIAAGAGVAGAVIVHASQWALLKLTGDASPLAHALIVTAPQVALTAAPSCAIVAWALTRLERAFDPRRSPSELFE